MSNGQLDTHIEHLKAIIKHSRYTHKLMQVANMGYFDENGALDSMVSSKKTELSKIPCGLSQCKTPTTIAYSVA